MFGCFSQGLVGLSGAGRGSWCAPYEFFCGTLTVTCEGFREAVILLQVPAGPLGDNSPSSFSHLLGSRLSSVGDHTLSPS